MRYKVLVVDDMEINRDILSEILEEDYNVITAENGIEALKRAEENADGLALILLDLMMPEMDGFAVLERLRHSENLKRIPVIIITGSDSVDSAKRCYEYEVADFIRKPFDESLVKLRVGNIVELYASKNHLEDKVAEQQETLQQQYEKLQQQAERLAQNNRRIVSILGTIVESRNLESGQHIQRVRHYTEILANQMMASYPEYGLMPEIIDIMISASELHDIGKVAIADKILLKPGRLDPEEYEIMKTHTTKGCIILDSIGGAWNKEYAHMSYEICRHHHERFDGRGYPDGLTGDDIPVSAQIVSIADVYDALVNERVYKAAYANDAAFDMIVGGECGKFSPKLLESFKAVRAEFEKVKA